MFKMLTCALVLVLSAGLAAAQIIDIDDIQEYLPDGTPNSPYDGETVTVRGSVFVTYGTYNSGTHYIQGATGGINFFQPSSGLVVGELVEVTGTVGSFGGEIDIEGPTVTIIAAGPEPDPLVLTPSEVVADYEHVGSFASVMGVVTAVALNSFELGADGGVDLYVYIDSDTGIDISDVDVGDLYQVLGPVVTFNGLIEMKPRFQDDLVEDPDVVATESMSLTGIKDLFD